MKRDIKTIDDAHGILNIHGIDESRIIVRDAPEDAESYSRGFVGLDVRDEEVWICDLKDALKIIDDESNKESACE
ncbi:MAG: hypothetical protein ACTH7L_01625 [Psychrobacter alimentarius]